MDPNLIIDVLSFNQACGFLRDIQAIKNPPELLHTFFKAELHAEAVPELMGIRNAIDLVGLGDILRATIADHLDKCIRPITKSLEAIHMNPDGSGPVVQMLNPACLARYATGIADIWAAPLDAILTSGDTILFTRLNFIRDAHVLLQKASELYLTFKSWETAQARIINAQRVQQVLAVYSHLTNLKAFTGGKDLFTPSSARFFAEGSRE